MLASRWLGGAAKILILIVLLALVFSYFRSFKLVRTEEFNSSLSSFVSLEGADEYVIATLRSDETLTKQSFRKTFFDLPIGDTEASLSVSANYKYFIRLADVKHYLEGETLYIKVPDLELSLPVAFHISSMSERSKKTGFGTNEDALAAELRMEMARHLRVRGNLQKASVYEAAAKSIADNFNRYLDGNGYSGMYESIVVVFDGVKNEVNQRFDYVTEDCGYFPCNINWRVGGYHILSEKK